MKYIFLLIWAFIFLFNLLFTIMIFTDFSVDTVLAACFLYGVTIPTLYIILSAYFISNNFFTKDRIGSMVSLLFGNMIFCIALMAAIEPGSFDDADPANREAKAIFSLLNAFGEYSYIIGPLVVFLISLKFYISAYKGWGFEKKLKDDDYFYFDQKDT